MPPEVVNEELVIPVTPGADDAGEGDSEGDIWGTLDSNFDLEYEDAEPLQREPVAEELTQPQEDVVAPPPEVPAVAEAPPVAEQPVAPPVAEAPQPAEPQWQPPQLPPPEQLEAVRSTYMQQLAETYKLDEATAELIDTNFSAVAPQLLSQVHMRVAESVTQTLGQMLPQLINSHMQYMQVAQRSTDMFFSEWPELNQPQYQNTLGQVAQMYRQLKPNASTAEFVRDVGIQAWTALGLPVQQLLTRGQQQVAEPTAPMSQETFPQGGYAPATPGAPARSQRPPSARSDNPFSQLAEEFMLDDQY